MKRRTFIGSLLAGLLASPGLALARPGAPLTMLGNSYALWLPTSDNFFGIDRTFATQLYDASGANMLEAIEKMETDMREASARMAIPRWPVPNDTPFGPGDTDDRAEPW